MQTSLNTQIFHSFQKQTKSFCEKKSNGKNIRGTYLPEEKKLDLSYQNLNRRKLNSLLREWLLLNPKIKEIEKINLVGNSLKSIPWFLIKEFDKIEVMRIRRNPINHHSKSFQYLLRRIKLLEF